MAQVVSDKGYAATTVADVVERAGVSRRTFYEQFADKEACFLAAYDAGLAAVLCRVGGAVEVNPTATGGNGPGSESKPSSTSSPPNRPSPRRSRSRS